MLELLRDRTHQLMRGSDCFLLAEHTMIPDAGVNLEGLISDLWLWLKMLLGWEGPIWESLNCEGLIL